jgi:hypothetical protein
MQKWLNSKANTQRNWKHFDDAIHPASDELAYAILLNKDEEIVLVASLFAEYKLTRNLCTVFFDLCFRLITCKSSTRLAARTNNYFSREK